MGLVLAVAFMAAPRTLLAAGPAPVDLGSCAHFAILAGAAITSTGGGAINGDVGASPIAGSAIGVTCGQVNGTIYEASPGGPACAIDDATLLTAAKGDLTTAINDAAGRSPTPSGPFLNPGAAYSSGYNIGGMVLAPGLYKFGSGQTAFIETDVTLNGGPDDVWIFQCGADLQMASGGIHVILAGGAQARNVFWQVANNVAIGTSAAFKGTIMANQGVVLDTTSTLEGRAMSFTAAVTFNGISGSLPAPAAPIFTNISRTTSSATVVLNTSPYFLLTLQASPSLSLPNWTTIITDTPVTSPWTFTDTTATATVTQRFYRAFITIP